MYFTNYSTPLEQYEGIFLYIYQYDPYLLEFILDLSFFQIIIPLIIIIIIILLLLAFFLDYSRLIPNSILQRVSEYAVKFVFNLIKQQIGLFGYPYVVLIFSIFFGVLFLNLLSLLPFGIALTSHLIIILYLSLSICLGIFFAGFIRVGSVFFKVFLPSCPLIMLPLLLLIELFSYIIRMFSLAIRLVANIMAGHTLISIISSFSLLITNLNFFSILIGIILICIIMVLELGVACLQAYVFTILVLIYMNDIFGGSH